MRSLSLLALLCTATLVPVGAASAADTTNATLVVRAEFHSRTSLRVSSELLRFDVASPERPATVSVDFMAGARTQSGGEVLLTVERLHALEGPGGAADVESSVSFDGHGTGTLAGDLPVAGVSVAGRWQGSGLRTGNIVFALRAAASGSYVLPVRFVLSAP
jgi:hypothetical protein